MNESLKTAEAYLFCRNLAKSHYENFPVASLFIPKKMRKHFFACYAFLRTADDYADNEALPAANRLQQLLNWEKQLDDCYAGKADHPVFIALGETVRTLMIPVELFKNLLNAFKTDLFKNRYRHFNELLEYCEYSANPVGRLTLYMLGYSGHDKIDIIMKASDDICTGLQLTNHWQDVFVDQKKDRLYLPLEDLERFGYSADLWQRRTVNEDFFRLMAFQVERANQYFENGTILFPFLKFPEKHEIRLVWNGGKRILEKIRKNGYDVLNHRPELGVADKVLIFSRIFKNIKQNESHP